MFTFRFDQRIWQRHILALFPNSPHHLSENQIRSQIYSDLDKVRELRNRIAHPEPIVARNLAEDFNRIERLVMWRCEETASWMHRNLQA